MSVFRHCTTHELYIHQQDLPKADDGRIAFFKSLNGPVIFVDVFKKYILLFLLS